jgi:hypothetical protein
MYAQLLIAASFAIASYQDVRERAVNDLVWLPAVGGVVLSAYTLYVSAPLPAFEFMLLKVGLLGGIALTFTYFGGIGQADAIAIAFVAADPSPISPILPLLGGATVALSHMGYEFAIGNARGKRTIPMDRFLKEQRWIPKAIVSDGVRTEVSRDVNVAREEAEANKPDAMVEVSYGVPTVAYLGVGYLGYIVYLVLFNLSGFFALP